MRLSRYLTSMMVFLLAVAVAAVLLQKLVEAPWVAALRTVALDATIVLTVVSGFHYAWAVSRRGNSQAPNGSVAK